MPCTCPAGFSWRCRRQSARGKAFPPLSLPSVATAWRKPPRRQGLTPRAGFRVRASGAASPSAGRSGGKGGLRRTPHPVGEAAAVASRGSRAASRRPAPLTPPVDAGPPRRIRRVRPPPGGTQTLFRVRFPSIMNGRYNFIWTRVIHSAWAISAWIWSGARAVRFVPTLLAMLSASSAGTS